MSLGSLRQQCHEVRAPSSGSDPRPSTFAHSAEVQAGADQARQDLVRRSLPQRPVVSDDARSRRDRSRRPFAPVCRTPDSVRAGGDGTRASVATGGGGDQSWAPTCLVHGETQRVPGRLMVSTNIWCQNGGPAWSDPAAEQSTPTPRRPSRTHPAVPDAHRVSTSSASGSSSRSCPRTSREMGGRRRWSCPPASFAASQLVATPIPQAHLPIATVAVASSCSPSSPTSSSDDGVRGSRVAPRALAASCRASSPARPQGNIGASGPRSPTSRAGPERVRAMGRLGAGIGPA